MLHYFRLGVEASNPDKLSAAATKADIAALGAALKSAIENQPIQIQRQLEEKREEEPQEHDDWKSKPLLARILKK